MKGFFIEITNNLLEQKHRKKMGTAVWEFMWCLDKITKIDDDGIGWVLGGKPIQLKEIKRNIGITENKISKNLNKLQDEGYLKLQKTQYGLIVYVNRAKKRFAQKVKTENSDLPLKAKLNSQKGKTESCPKGQNHIIDDKTVVNDKTVMTVAPASGAPSNFDLNAYLKDMIENQPKHIKIIGVYAKAKRVEWDNVEQARSFIKRNLAAARMLVGYKIDLIIHTMKKVREIPDLPKWTLETIGKFIDEENITNSFKNQTKKIQEKKNEIILTPEQIEKNKAKLAEVRKDLTDRMVLKK